MQTADARQASGQTVPSVNRLFSLVVSVWFTVLPAFDWKMAAQNEYHNKRANESLPHSRTPARPHTHNLLDIVRSSFAIDCLLPTVRVLNVMAPAFGRWKPTGRASYVTRKKGREKWEIR